MVIKKYNTFINESLKNKLKDRLKDKSENEILDNVKNLSPKEKLIKGSRYGILSLVKQAIEEGFDPSIYNNIAIRLASNYGHLDIVKYLLKDERVDPTAWKNWSIELASQEDHLEVVKELLKGDRVRNKLSKEELNYYKKQVSNLNESLKDKLKGKSESEILDNVKDLTPYEKLEKGIRYGILSLIKQSIEEGVDPSIQHNYAIRYASEYDHLDIVKYLLKDERVDPLADNNWAIRIASYYGHLDVVKELLKDDRVDPTDLKNAAIRYASEYGHLDVVKELLKDERVINTLSEERLKKYKKQIS